jgi:hypothetical protein
MHAHQSIKIEPRQVILRIAYVGEVQNADVGDGVVVELLGLTECHC